MKTLIKDKMTLNIEPNHPLTRDLLGFSVELEGEKITKCAPRLGYSHRGFEKTAQDKLFTQYLPVVEKIDYLSEFFYAQAYIAAAEELLEIEPPKTAQYIRVLTMELNRISSHLFWLGQFISALGNNNAVFSTFNIRNEILDIFEKITGGRMTHNYYVFGGVRKKISNEILNNILNFTKNFNQKFKIIENMITQNPIFIDRTRNIGVLTTEKALSYSITGVNLRASGYALDFRKEKPYLTYDELDFSVPTAFAGDCYSRYKLRLDEIKTSLDIVNQCTDWLLTHNNEKINLNLNQIDIKPKAGRAVSYTESARGLVMCHLFTDGSEKPSRIKWRTPSFYAVQILEKLAVGCSLTDFTALYGSLDILAAEAER